MIIGINKPNWLSIVNSGRIFWLMLLLLSSCTAVWANVVESGSVEPNSVEPKAPNVFADPGPIVTQFNHFNGASFPAIFRLRQDSSGFIWLATEQGLMRFDGYDMKHFEHDETDPNSLTNARIVAINEDNQGYLWIATFGGGLERFDKSTFKVTHYKHQNNASGSIGSDKILDAFLAHDNRLWLATDKGIEVFDTQTGKSEQKNQQFAAAFEGGEQPIMMVYEDSSHELWFAGPRNGIYRFTGNGELVAHYQHDINNPNSLDSNGVRRMLQDHEGKIWLATTKGMNQLDLESGQFTRYVLPVKARNSLNALNIRTIYEDDKQRLWIGSLYNGLLYFNREKQQFEEVNQNAQTEQTFDSLSAADIIADRSGGLWIGSLTKGLYKVNSAALSFQSLVASANQPLRIGALFEDKHGINWVAGNDTLYRYDEVLHQTVMQVKMAGFINGISQYDPQVLTLSVLDKGIYYYDLNNGALTQAPELPNQKIMAIHYDQAGTLWCSIGRSGSSDKWGLFSLAKGADQFQFRKATINASLIWSDKEDELLVGAWDGLYRYRFSTDEWMQILYQQKEIKVWSAVKDRQGRIWLGTQKDGLLEYDQKQQVLKKLERKSRLTGTSVSSIVADTNGYLWLGTGQGLFQFSIADQQIRRFTTEEGVRISRFGNINNGTNTVSGDIMMADETHVIRFSPNLLVAQDKMATEFPVLFTNLNVLNVPVDPNLSSGSVKLTHIISDTEQLTLSYRDYLFSLDFVSTNFDQQSKLKYAYQMEGLNDQWIIKSNQDRRVTFTSLSAGDYRLKVKSSDAKGRFADSFTELKISVTPPLWRTWPAYAFYVIATVLLILALYRRQTRSLIERAEALEWGVAERTKTINKLLEQKKNLFASISHEFRTPLTLILSPLDMLLKSSRSKQKQGQLRLIKRNAMRLLRMVDQLLEFAKLEMVDIQKNEVTSVKATLDMILGSFELTFRSKGLSVELTHFEDVKLAVIPDSLNKILINLISNACKYSNPNGHIKISVIEDEGCVEISVADDGIGIDINDHQAIFERFNRTEVSRQTKVSGSGIGLALVKELVEANGGEIRLISQLDQGATFIVILPIDTSDIDLAPEGIDQTRQSTRDYLEMVDSDIENDVNTTAQQVSVSDASAKCVILVVEDNADLRGLLQTQLSDDYQVISCEEGKTGLEFARKYIPDMIISDIMMPVMDGYEMTTLLKKDVLTSHIPIMLLSAKGSLESRLQGLQLLVDDYLAKPFHIDELQLRVRNIISIREIVRRRYSQAINSDNPIEMVEKLGLSKVEEQFMAQVEEALEGLYSDPLLVNSQLSAALGLSERQLYRKLKSVFDLSFAELVRNFRLGKAAELLKEGQRSSYVYHMVGFSSHSYFSQCFKAKFGCTPKNYQQSITNRPVN